MIDIPSFKFPGDIWLATGTRVVSKTCPYWFAVREQIYWACIMAWLHTQNGITWYKLARSYKDHQSLPMDWRDVLCRVLTNDGDRGGTIWDLSHLKEKATTP